MSDTQAVRCAACLRAVIKTPELAAVLRVDLRRFSEEVTAGRVPQAQPAHEPRGFIFDAADAMAMIRDHYPPGPERVRAERELLGLRSGALRVKNQRIEAVPGPEWPNAVERVNPTDSLLDDELRDVIAAARSDLGERVSSSVDFDAWAVDHAHGITQVDLLIRLGGGSWRQVVAASESASEAAPVGDLDMRDPETAIRAYSEQFGAAPTKRKFDHWAPGAGCPLTCKNIERMTGLTFGQFVKRCLS